MTGKQAQKRTLLICVIIAALTAVAFEGVRSNGFIDYDDGLYVTSNPWVQEGLSFKSVAWAFTSRHASNWHPLTWISHIIDYSIFGASPAGHHLVNAGFHIVNVLLLFLILKKMTGAFWKSVFVAAVFGLHPLAVESVAWVAERKNVLSTFFAFLTIAAYLGYSRRPGLRRYVVVVVLFAAGLLSKPMLVTLPFVLMLLDYWPLKRFSSKFSLVNSFYEKLPFLVMSAASCVVTYVAQAEGGSVADITAVPMNLRAGNAIVSYIRYIGKIFYPVSLGVLYPRELNGPALWQAGVSLLLLALVSLAAFALRRRFGWLFTGWFCYLGTLAPVIGLVQVGVQGMADRYMYLPGIGIYIIVVWLIGNEAAKLRIPKVVIGAAGVLILGVLLMMTRAQARYWKDGVSLYGRTLAVTENNYMMQEKLGNLLRIEGRTDEAIGHFMRAVEIRPLFAKAHTGLGLALADKGLFDKAAAQFERALAIEPNSIAAHNSYGVMLAERGVYDKAFEQFRGALTNDAHFSGVLSNLCNAGIEARKLDDVLDVIEGWKLKKPDDAELYYWAGIIYGRKGDKVRAVEQFDKAMRMAESQGNEELIARMRKTNTGAI